MADPVDVPVEETLDPEDWAAMRALGHRMLDDALDYIASLRDRPPWVHAPAEVKAHFEQALPVAPQRPDEVYREYAEYIRPYQLGNSHPRFWGWVGGSGTVMGALAEFLAAATDSISGSMSYHSNNYAELQVLGWFRDMFGFPPAASGVITSGCSASNLIALAVARNAKAGYDVRTRGVRAAQKPMTVYCSEEAHSSIQRAVEVLGLGSDSLRRVPVNASLQIDLGALAAAIERDRGAGLQPFCVVGAAGTTNTGAIDDLAGLADICTAEGLWFHVDGAFGAWAAIAPRYRHLVAGQERADSLAFDLHKWMYLPYPIGGVLVRNAGDHHRAFAQTPSYLAHGEGERGLTGVDVPWFSDYSFELSRGFLALKAWMTLKEHGADKYGRLIQQNIDQARYLAGLVDASPHLELALPAPLNVVCFRYVRPGLNGAALDALNKQIEVELQEGGIAVPSIVTFGGRKYLHVAICNHRSRRDDFDLLAQETVRIGHELMREGGHSRQESLLVRGVARGRVDVRMNDTTALPGTADGEAAFVDGEVLIEGFTPPRGEAMAPIRHRFTDVLFRSGGVPRAAHGLMTAARSRGGLGLAEGAAGARAVRAAGSAIRFRTVYLGRTKVQGGVRERCSGAPGSKPTGR